MTMQLAFYIQMRGKKNEKALQEFQHGCVLFAAVLIVGKPECDNIRTSPVITNIDIQFVYK